MSITKNVLLNWYSLVKKCWLLGKNLSNFESPVWKLHNPYCHSADLCIHFYWLSWLRQASHRKMIQRSELRLRLWLRLFKISWDTPVFGYSKLIKYSDLQQGSTKLLLDTVFQRTVHHFHYIVVIHLKRTISRTTPGTTILGTTASIGRLVHFEVVGLHPHASFPENHCN